MIVEPSTTCASSDRPLKAATVRVVGLFDAAIDHSVSPGCTMCGTAADAGAAGIMKAMLTTSRRVGRTFSDLRGSGCPVILARQRRSGNRSARGYDTLQRGVMACSAAWSPPI